jgi:glycosyltransferase involved in cell wall biosynthesis
MKISVSMIVRNERSCIAKALNSVADADEIIVCDTGSTDDTVEIAQNYGAKVFTDYLWNDNFAEARNHSLDKCKGDWVLIIDADEHLEPGGINKVRELLQSGINGHNTVYFQTIAEGGSQNHNSIRIFKRNSGIRWKGAAHNYLTESKGYFSDIKLFYGYSPTHKADPDRTLRILQKEVDSNPNQPRETYYLAREYYYRQNWTEAIRYYQDYLNIATWGPEIADAWLMLARCHHSNNDSYNARECAMKAIITNANFKEAILFMAELSGPKNARRWREIAETATNEDVLFIRKCDGDNYQQI